MSRSRNERDAERLQKSRADNARAGFASVIGDRDGRAFLWQLLAQCELYQDGFSSTPGVTERNTGKRAVGLWVLTQIHDVDPDAYVLMLKENRSVAGQASEPAAVEAEGEE